MRPWEHYSTDETHFEAKYGYTHHYYRARKSRNIEPTTFKAHFTTVKDNDRLWTRKGDVVQFGHGYHGYVDGWKRWFLKTKDVFKFMAVNKAIPKYARNQYAIVLNRYKWVKYKWMIYQDYGTIIMMLTGPWAGHVRRYYAYSHPWRFVAKYPYTQKRKHIGVDLSEKCNGYNLINTRKRISSELAGEEERDTFLTCVYYLIRGSDPNDPKIEEIAKKWLIG